MLKIALLFVAFIAFILISFRINPPLKEKNYHYYGGKGTYDKAVITVKHISSSEYNEAKMINVFFDHNYDEYYKLEVKFIKNKEETKVDVFYTTLIPRIYSRRGDYAFNIKVDGKIYHNAFHINNRGSLRPSFSIEGRLVWKK